MLWTSFMQASLASSLRRESGQIMQILVYRTSLSEVLSNMSVVREYPAKIAKQKTYRQQKVEILIRQAKWKSVVAGSGYRPRSEVRITDWKQDGCRSDLCRKAGRVSFSVFVVDTTSANTTKYSRLPLVHFFGSIFSGLLHLVYFPLGNSKNLWSPFQRCTVVFLQKI